MARRTLLLAVLAWAQCAAAEHDNPPAPWQQRLQQAEAARFRSPEEARRMTAAIRADLGAGPVVDVAALSHVTDCWSLMESDSAAAVASARAGLALEPALRSDHVSRRLALCELSAQEIEAAGPDLEMRLDRMLTEAGEDLEVRAEVLRARGEIRSNRGGFADALTDLAEACDLYESRRRTLDMLYCRQAMAVVRFRSGDYAGSSAILERIIPEQERLGHTFALADALYNLARAQEGAGLLDAATTNFRRCIELSKTIADDTSIAFAQYRLGAVLGVRGQTGEGLQLLDAALAHFVRTDDRDVIANIQAERARLLLVQRQLDAARTVLQGAIARYREKSYLPELRAALGQLSEIEEAAGNMPAALAALKQAVVVHRELEAVQRHDAVAHLIVEYDAEQREKENLDLRRQQQADRAALQVAERIDRQQKIIILLAALLLGGAVLAGLRLWRGSRRMRDMALTDELTGIPNRRSILAYLEAQIAAAARGQGTPCVIILDIDHFKSINDSYGHDIGDQVLKKTVKVCVEQLRGSDRIGRTGGEEFMVVLPNATLQSATEVAERLRRAVAAARCVDAGIDVNVTISCGLSQWMPTDAAAVAVIKRADTALYRAKHSGRDRVDAEAV